MGRRGVDKIKTGIKPYLYNYYALAELGNAVVGEIKVVFLLNIHPPPHRNLLEFLLLLFLC
jgi:hypothetical protein